METLGERLTYVRKTILQMSQKSFAGLLHLSQGALSDAENNNRGLSMEAIIELIKYSKSDNRISYEWILTGEVINVQNHINEEHQELVNTYDLLDKRGQHKIHTVIYEELDRMKANKSSLNKTEFQQNPETGDSVSKMALHNNLVRK